MATYEKSKDKTEDHLTDFTNDAHSEQQITSKNDRMSTIDLEDDKLHEMTASYSEISFDSQPSPVDGSITEDQSDLTALQCMEKRRIETDYSMKFDDRHESDSKRPNTLDLKNESDFTSTDSIKYHKALEDLQMEGTVTQEGDMVLFVAEDLETKIKLASPVSKKGETPPFPGSRSSTPSLYRQALMPQLPNIDPNVLYDIEMEARRVATSVDTLTENLAGILHSVSALTVECLETYRDAVCKTCDAVDSNIKSMYQLMAKCEELSKSMKSIYKLSEQIKEIKRLLDLFENVVNS
ncbi:hypothetical protein B566_EDAN002648 [Ephemera danica]|nr:hypothetical protein B566_EDAN002648 [Ephemera danica]